MLEQTCLILDMRFVAWTQVLVAGVNCHLIPVTLLRPHVRKRLGEEGASVDVHACFFTAFIEREGVQSPFIERRRKVMFRCTHIEVDLDFKFEFEGIKIRSIGSKSGEIIKSNIRITKTTCWDFVKLILLRTDSDCVSRVGLRLDSWIDNSGG